MPFRLLLWLSYCYARIYATWCVEVGILVFQFIAIFAILRTGLPLWICAVILGGALSVSARLEASIFDRVKRDTAAKAVGQRTDPMLSARYLYLERLLSPLAALHRVAIPTIYFEDVRKMSMRTMIGIFDSPVANHVLTLHPHIPGMVTERELTGILAHEFRHSVAFDSYLSTVTRVLSRAMSGFSIATLLLVIAAVFRSDLTVFGAVGGLIRAIGNTNLAVIALGMVSNSRTRAIEFKTDALGVWDLKCGKLGDHNSLINGLTRVVNIGESEYPEWVKKSRSAQVFIKVLTLLSTHPSTRSRIWVLRWIYGSPSRP